jgi:glutamate carboxypeptidase
MISDFETPVPMRAFLAEARRRQAALIELIGRLVEIESPSDDKAAVDSCVAFVAAHAKALGGHIKLHRQRAFGDVLEARFGPRAQAGGPNASWASGHRLAARDLEGYAFPQVAGPAFRAWSAGHEGRRRHGFTAIELLSMLAGCSREIVLLLNSDEEVGSPVSRPITERLAAGCAAVYVLEPAQGLAYKTARKGTGNWRIDVQGVAAHAGVDFEKGASAIRELARVVETVSGWTDLKRGLTVSVGLAGGGSKTNVIPAERLGRGRCAHRPTGRWDADRAQVRRTQGPGQALHFVRNRRHQPAAHGAHARHRSPLPAGEGFGS